MRHYQLQDALLLTSDSDLLHSSAPGSQMGSGSTLSQAGSNSGGVRDPSLNQINDANLHDNDDFEFQDQGWRMDSMDDDDMNETCSPTPFDEDTSNNSAPNHLDPDVQESDEDLVHVLQERYGDEWRQQLHELCE
jgi:hypothetical protein